MLSVQKYLGDEEKQMFSERFVNLSMETSGMLHIICKLNINTLFYTSVRNILKK